MRSGGQDHHPQRHGEQLQRRRGHRGRIPQHSHRHHRPGQHRCRRHVHGDGVAILSSTDNRVIGNHTFNNGPFAGIGVYSLIDGDHSRATQGTSARDLIDGNNSHDNITTRLGVVNLASTEADGVRLEPGSVGNTVSNNQLWNNGLDGIAVFAQNSTDNVIRNNQIFGNGRRTAARRGDGIRVFASASRTVIEGNRVFKQRRQRHHRRVPVEPDPVQPGGRQRRPPPLNPNNANTFTFDLNDTNANCDANVWFGNTYRTTRLPCSANGGQQI